MKISVVIHTYNEEKRLRTALESVKGFDEIVVCDMESTDKTLDIAREYDCKILTFPKGEWTIPEPARNFAIHQATHEWILSVDADEIVPEALKNYLYEKVKEPDCPAGILMPCKNHFMGKFMHCSYPNYILRFFKKEGTYWPPYIHTRPQVQGTLYKIPAKRKDLAIIHLSNDTMSVLVGKMNQYTDNEVEKRRHKNYGKFALFHRPLVRFCRAYIIKGGFRDGIRGLIRACLIAHYQFVMVAKVIEERKYKNAGPED